MRWAIEPRRRACPPARRDSSTLRCPALPHSACIAAAAAPAAQQQKIRIKLKSYWVDLLHDSVEKIREAASSTGATIAGPVPLPTR